MIKVIPYSGGFLWCGNGPVSNTGIAPDTGIIVCSTDAGTIAGSSRVKLISPALHRQKTLFSWHSIAKMSVDGLVMTRQGVFGLIILVLLREVSSLTAVR